MQESAEFGELRRSYRSFAFPLTVAFIAWWYSRHAAAKLDPKAAAIKSRMEGGA